MQVFLLVVCTVFRQGSLYMQMHLHPEQFSFGKDGLLVHELLPHQLASFHHVAG